MQDVSEGPSKWCLLLIIPELRITITKVFFGDIVEHRDVLESNERMENVCVVKERCSHHKKRIKLVADMNRWQDSEQTIFALEQRSSIGRVSQSVPWHVSCILSSSGVCRRDEVKWRYLQLTTKVAATKYYKWRHMNKNKYVHIPRRCVVVIKDPRSSAPVGVVCSLVVHP